jgi:nicotinamide riboside transporter PnuC
MHLPLIYESGISIILYLFLLLIIILGLWRFITCRYLLKDEQSVRFRSVVPLGWAAVAIGFIGLFKQYYEAFQAIEAAGDISASIVAEAMGSAFTYPLLGFLCLAFSYVFQFVNQNLDSTR